MRLGTAQEFSTKFAGGFWLAGVERVGPPPRGLAVPKFQERSAGNSKATAILITRPINLQTSAEPLYRAEAQALIGLGFFSRMNC